MKVVWKTDLDTALAFARIHDQVENRLISRAEAFDKIRLLPGFPAGFDPMNDELAVQIKPPPTRVDLRGLIQ